MAQSLRRIHFLTALLVSALPSAAAQRPMIFTESAHTLGKNQYNVGLAFEYLHKSSFQPAPFPRELYRLFVVSFHSGVAENVNMDLDWRGGLVGVRSDGFRASDWGDLVVGTKLNLFGERGNIPAVGLRTSIKLSNTTYHPNRLGSNEMDYYTHLLFTKRWSDLESRVNLGFGILGDPRSVGQQDDVYSFALALSFPLSTRPRRARAIAEIVGVTGYQDNDDKVVMRGGISIAGIGLIWNLYGSFRLFGNSEDFGTAFELSESWGVGVLIRKEFSFDPFGFMREEKEEKKE